MGWIQRFLTCEAYDLDLSVDRALLLRAAFPIARWSMVLVGAVLGVFPSGSCPALPWMISCTW